jgi:hypothetical protein
MKLNPDSHMPKFFLEQIYTLLQQTPLPENLARVRTSTHGCQIVSRLHAFGSVKDEVDESGGDDQEMKPLASDSHRPSWRIWTLAESEKSEILFSKVKGQLKLSASVSKIPLILHCVRNEMRLAKHCPHDRGKLKKIKLLFNS